jgi:hypothetical protein
MCDLWRSKVTVKKKNEEGCPADLHEIALDFLRPYVTDSNCRPIDIVRIPPTDIGAFRIQFDKDAWTVAIAPRDGGQEPVSFAVAELYVEIEKELKRHYIPSSPRDLAKELIRRDVDRGATLKSLVDGGQGRGWFGYHVSIGGFIQAGGKSTSLGCRHILVSEYEGKRCQYIFKLEDIYREVKLERQSGVHIEQLTLL